MSANNIADIKANTPAPIPNPNDNLINISVKNGSVCNKYSLNCTKLIDISKPAIPITTSLFNFLFLSQALNLRSLFTAFHHKLINL